jgi:hypothetical protein
VTNTTSTAHIELPNSGGGTLSAAGLRSTELAVGYSGAQILTQFYVPVLSRAVTYDRSVGFFTATSIASAAAGVSRFVANGGRMRLLIGHAISPQDRDALIGATEIPAALASELASRLVPSDQIARRRLEVLAWLARQGRLHVKVAVPVGPDGVPLPPEQAGAYFHEKIGILRDTAQDGVVFQGSANESSAAWDDNFESISVFKSWDGSAPSFEYWAAEFEQRWAGHIPRFKVFDLPDPAVLALLRLVPNGPPDQADPLEPLPAPPANAALLAKFLMVAPQLVGAEGLAEATVGVQLLPHQQKVVGRLAGTWPRPWLIADEVGLGKTISAGMALRQLLLRRRAERVLILAPAGVCRQWQLDELFEKFGLWVPRLDRGKIWGVHPDDVRPLRPGENPYATYPVLIASSHLARRPDQRQLMLAAPQLDLLIIDEAHHARRYGADRKRRRPSQLLRLLDETERAGHTRTMWLLTATPMQLDAVELTDLLRYVGLSGPLQDVDQFERYYRELAKTSGSDTDWGFLAQHTAHTDLDAADQAILEDIRQQCGVRVQTKIRQFGQGPHEPAEVAAELGADGQHQLRRWLRQRGPLGQTMTRHTRRALRMYYQQGRLDQPIAMREAQSAPIKFNETEIELYRGLDSILDRLMQQHGSRHHAGFVLTVYRRRLTSSWAAIQSTISRRLDPAGRPMQLELGTADDPEDDDFQETDSGTYIDDNRAVPLTRRDRDELRDYLGQLERVHDSKYDRLLQDINTARGSGQPIIIFSAYTDTLDSLRDRLQPTYREQLATYTGAGGSFWDPQARRWQPITKRDLVQRLDDGQIKVLLATDAASEGLNLQTASYLVNFDMPWNPMRAEQRIGRIDRIGQQRPIITIRNYFIADTVEQKVYDVLARRIDIFAGLIGNLQPILGATEEAFKKIFRAPLSERQQAQTAIIGQLNQQIDQLGRTGIALDPDEDPWPIPSHHSPLDLHELHAVLDRLHIHISTPGQPATSSPVLVAHEPQKWCALTTYGHPQLMPALRQSADTYQTEPDQPVVFVQSGPIWAAYRADLTPPTPVHTITELDQLGPAIATNQAIRLAQQVIAMNDQTKYDNRQQMTFLRN